MRQIKGFLGTTVPLMLCALIAQLAYLLVAGFAGWIAPMWQGGEALFPLFFGTATVFVGALPLNVFIRAVFRAIDREYTSMTAILVGLTIGISLLPVQNLIAPSVTSIKSWQSIDPIVGVLVLMGLSVIVSALLGAAVVFPFSSHDSEYGKGAKHELNRHNP